MPGAIICWHVPFILYIRFRPGWHASRASSCNFKAMDGKCNIYIGMDLQFRVMKFLVILNSNKIFPFWKCWSKFNIFEKILIHFFSIHIWWTYQNKIPPYKLPKFLWKSWAMCMESIQTDWFEIVNVRHLTRHHRYMLVNHSNT